MLPAPGNAAVSAHDQFALPAPSDDAVPGDDDAAAVAQLPAAPLRPRAAWTASNRN
jgi:hypothetical protein